MKLMRILTMGAAIIAAVAVIVAAGRHDKSAAAKSHPHMVSHPIILPVKPATYLGMYAPGLPASYAGVAAFTQATGVRPDVVLWYIGWLEPFQASLAAKIDKAGAVPLIQIDPMGTSLEAIASGQYDGYLSSYAEAVNTYGRPVIMSFGHEMNGSWYSWGYRHSPPTAFVAAWRHIVTLFRTVGVANVTWLWTINIIHPLAGIPSPGPWWPGSAYVTWVGIDGYYTSSSQSFAPLFGPTIVAVRALTSDPILLAETGVSPNEGQPAKIADLFAGIRTYGLLGFMWFDAIGQQDWRIRSPAAVAAFRKGADTFTRPGS